MTRFLTDLQNDSLGVGPLGEHVPGASDRSWPEPATAPRSGLTSASAWAEMFYCIIGLAPAIVFFVGTITLISIGVGLAVIYVGVAVLMLGLLFARAGGHLQRILAGVMLSLPVPGPAPIRSRRPGFTGLVAAVLTDPGCWRAVSYHCVKILLAPLMFSIAVGFYAAGLGAVTYPLWFGWLPLQYASDGTLHRGTQWAPNLFVDNAWTIGLQFCLGVAVLLLAPRAVRMVTTMDRVLIAGLLGGPGR